jgi:hypothetical protein
MPVLMHKLERKHTLLLPQFMYFKYSTRIKRYHNVIRDHHHLLTDMDHLLSLATVRGLLRNPWFSGDGNH